MYIFCFNFFVLYLTKTVLDTSKWIFEYQMIVLYYPKSELLSIYYCDTIDTSDTLWRIIPVHRLLTLTIKISVVKETPSWPSISIFKIFYNPTAYMWNYLLSIKSMNKIYLNIYIEINYAQHSLDIRATTVALINKI